MRTKTNREEWERKDVHVDLGHAADEQLQLTLVEHVNEVLRDELGEPRHERVELLLDTPRDTVLHDPAHVVLLILLRDGDIGTAGLRLDRDHLAEAVLSGSERLVDDVRDVVVATIKVQTQAAR